MTSEENTDTGDTTKDERTGVDPLMSVAGEWLSNAVKKREENTHENTTGTHKRKPTDTLALELNAKVGELTQKIHQANTAQTADIKTELDELGGVLLELYDRTHSESEFDLSALAMRADWQANMEHDTEMPALTGEDAIRERAEELVEQGVSSVSKISNTIIKEFETVDRIKVKQIAGEVRHEAGEMETKGDVSSFSEFER